MHKILALALATPAAIVMIPAVIVQGVIALRTDYRTNCQADAWMAQDFHQWADEIRAAHAA